MITFIIILVTCIASYKAFNDPIFKEKLLFSPYAVAKVGEYHRFVSSGFLHADWMHLIFNMFVLFNFGPAVESYYQGEFGIWANLLYLVLYFGSMIMADLATYYKHKDHSYYRSLGASGAVSGVLLAFILFNPLAPLQFIFLPGIDIPAIILGVGYLLYSFYAAQNVQDKINHDAHFYGAVFGFLFTLAISPGLGMKFIKTLFG